MKTFSFPGLVHQGLLGFDPSGRRQPTRRSPPAEPDVADERVASGGHREETGEVQDRLPQRHQDALPRWKQSPLCRIRKQS